VRQRDKSMSAEDMGWYKHNTQCEVQGEHRRGPESGNTKAYKTDKKNAFLKQKVTKLIK